MVVERDKFKLIEKTKSPQGKPVKKVIVFQRLPARGSQPQITDYLLVDDATGKEICSAKVTEIQVVDKLTWIPRRLELRWPDEKLKLTMRFNGATINHDVPQTAFVRTPMPGIASYDLATGKLDASPNSFQRAGGVR
jgi:outer membrane lipoprotein-sorting protein